MKHRSTTITIITAFMLVLALTGCDVAQEAQYGSLTLNFSPSGRIFSRTIMPEGETALDIAYYTISGSGPSGQSLASVNCSSATLTVNSLLVGDWTFTATAYNAADHALAAGCIEVYIISSGNTITLELDEVVGEGDMNLAFSWNPEQVNAQTQFTFTLENQSGEPVLGAHIVTDMSEGTSAVTQNLPAGFYTFTASLTSGGVKIAGYTESIRVIDGTASSASPILVIGKVIDNVNMIISDETDGVIIGTISSSQEVPVSGGTLTLTYQASDAAGVPAGDIVYQWYEDGIPISGAQNSTYTISSVHSGSVRYDIIVGTVDNPMMGSAGYTVEVTPHPAIVN